MQNSECLICSSNELVELLELGNFPPANFLTEVENDPTENLQITLLTCSNCGHLQQKYFYSPEKLFNHYLYQSGTSKTLDNFFDEIAGVTSDALSQGADILELACNDGTFLKKLEGHGFNVMGVDPAKNIVNLARSKGLDVVQGYWPLLINKKFDAIYAFNVLAHVTNPIEFFKGALSHLKDDGYIAVQTSQIKMVENAEFDTIYHEHYSFFTISSLNYLAEKFDLNVSIYETAVHGGSALAIFTKKISKATINQRIKSNIGKKFIAKQYVSLNDRSSDNQLNIFKNKCMTFKSRINEVINEQIDAGRKIVFVGAAAKTITVLFYSKANANIVLDEAPLKIGKYIPSTALKIASLDSVGEINEDCFFVIGAWNFFDELKSKLNIFRDPNIHKDIYYTYFPSERFE